MLRRSLITLAGFIVLSVSYKLDISDSEFKSTLDEPSSATKIFSCLLERDNDICDTVGKALKNILKDVMNTDCAKCSDEQSKAIGEFFARVSVTDPEKIRKTLDIYDPERENFKKYAASWRERGIKI